jgi:hypothetical protein
VLNSFTMLNNNFMHKGDKLICTKEVRNYLGWLLFEKGKEYDVLYVDHNDIKVMVCINHTLYGNEYNSFPIEWVREHFVHKK